MITVTIEDPLSAAAIEAAVAIRPAGAERLAAAIAVERSHENAMVLIAHDRGGPVGCAVLIPGDAAEVQDLYVRKALRGRGIAAHLMAQAETLAREAGAGWLRVETARGAEGAAAFYRRIGYRDCAAFGAYDPAGGSVFLEKKLGGAAGKAAQEKTPGK